MARNLSSSTGSSEIGLESVGEVYASSPLRRASSRRRELGVRVALGASRSALMRLLFAESVLLAAGGAAAALLVTGWTSGLLMGFAPPSDAPVSIRVPIDGTVLGFTLLAGILTAVLLGMLPAWTATSGNLVDALKDGTPGAGGSRRRVRAALVVVQVALSVVLLAAAGLCVRSLINARTIRTGFNTSGVLLASLDLYPHATSNEVVRSLYRSLLDGVGRAPGVSAVTMASSVPLGLDEGDARRAPQAAARATDGRRGGGPPQGPRPE